MRFTPRQRAWIRAALEDTLTYHGVYDYSERDVLRYHRTFVAMLSRRKIAPWRPSQPS